MGKIEELIEQLYPDGVKFKELGKVCKFQNSNHSRQVHPAVGSAGDAP
jgi:hypothetical protein